MSFNLEEHIDELVNLRRQLHSVAEPSGKEVKTAKTVSDYLKSTTPDELIENVGGCGIVARYKGGKEGPSVLIRCELDALPIPDEIDVNYRSQDEDVGHKCGHDGHMAIVCGVARLLKEHKIDRGEVLLLFQPSEETGEGAVRVLNDETFGNLKPDYVFALHNLPGFKCNQIVVKKDTFAAASVGFIARFRGTTSHAAHPEQGKSPALAMAQLIEALSAMPQFFTSLEQTAKATVVHASLGERALGTSPGHAVVMTTLRTYNDKTLDMLKRKAKMMAEGLAQTYDLKLETEWVEYFPATQNQEESVSLVTRVAGDKGLEVLEKNEPFGWSEDFGHFTKKYKGALFGLGAGEEQPRLHAPDYDFPDELIATGVAMFSGIIERITENDSHEF